MPFSISEICLRGIAHPFIYERPTMKVSVTHPFFHPRFDANFEAILPSVGDANLQRQKRRDPTQIFHAKLKAEKALRQLRENDFIEDRLFHIFEKIIAQEVAQENIPTRLSVPEDIKEAQAIQCAFSALLKTFDQPEEQQYVALCQCILASLEDDINALQYDSTTKKSPSAKQGEPDAHDHHHSHSHHHGNAKLNRLLKRLLGTSDVDEGPHGVIGAKAGITAISGQSEQDGPPSHMEEFHHGEIATSLGEAIGNGIASGIQMGAGALGNFAGRAERKESIEEKKNLLLAQRQLTKKRKDFLAYLHSSNTQEASEDPEKNRERLHNRRLVEIELCVIDCELQRIEARLKNNKYKKGLGVGSEVAGNIILSKGIIEILTKPLAYVNEVAAPIAANVVAFSSLGLSPAAAGAGLYMGVNSKKLTAAQLKEYNVMLKTAADVFDLIKEELPEEIREDYERFFSNGKWKTTEQGLRSLNKLMNWFVGGMAGYTAGMTGLTAAKIATLIVGTVAVADVTASTAVLASVVAVLYGTYGFMKYHANMHAHEEWADTNDAEFDSDFMKTLAAHGGPTSIAIPVSLAHMLDQRTGDYTDFLSGLAQEHGLRFQDAKIHSTDTDETRKTRREQKTGGKNATQQFIAAGERLSKNTLARTKATGDFLNEAAHHGIHGSSWKNAYDDARKTTNEKIKHPHVHENHHSHSEHENAHGHEHSGSIKRGVKKAISPVNYAAHILGRTTKNMLRPAVHHAGEVYAENTAYLTPLNLAAIFSRPGNYPSMVDLMIKDVSRTITYIEKKISEKMKIYDIPDEEIFSTESLYSDRDVENFRLDFGKNATSHRGRNWLGMKKRENSKDAGGSNSSEVTTKATTFDDGISAHWQNVGKNLAQDSALYEQAKELHSQLLSWKNDPFPTGEENAGKKSVPEMTSHYLDVMYEKISKIPFEKDRDVEKRLASYLMKDAPKRYRQKRSRLNTVFLATAPLRLAATLRKLAAQERKNNWTISHTDAGAPQLIPNEKYTGHDNTLSDATKNEFNFVWPVVHEIESGREENDASLST